MFSFKIALVFLAFRAEKERDNRDHPCENNSGRTTNKI